MFVCVRNKHGTPLMPCSPRRKARLLSNAGKADVVNRTPFTILLRHGSSGYQQPFSLGVDAGTQHVGSSATTEQTMLFEADVQLRTDIQKLLAIRRDFRRARRHRKKRYRAPRFLNRKRPEGWLAPSVQNTVDTPVKEIQRVRKMLPRSSVTVEVAQCDIQKIKSPAIVGEAYQQGEPLGFGNVREDALFRDKHRCQLCHGKSQDKILAVPHIERRKTGADAPGNHLTLGETCHHRIHQENLTHLFTRKHESLLGDAGQMTGMRWIVYRGIQRIFPAATLTYGDITKITRIGHGLEKRHLLDARCIRGHPMPLEMTYRIKPVRGPNRPLHQAAVLNGGIRKANQAPRYAFGFSLFHTVRYPGQECFVFGRRAIFSPAVAERWARTCRGQLQATHPGRKSFRAVDPTRERRERRFLPGLKARVSTP